MTDGFFWQVEIHLEFCGKEIYAHTVFCLFVCFKVF